MKQAPRAMPARRGSTPPLYFQVPSATSGSLIPVLANSLCFMNQGSRQYHSELSAQAEVYDQHVRIEWLSIQRRRAITPTHHGIDRCLSQDRRGPLTTRTLRTVP